MKDGRRAIGAYRTLLLMDPADPARLHYRIAKEADARGIEYDDALFAQTQPEAAA